MIAQKRQLDREQRKADQALGTALAKVDRLRRQRKVFEAEVLKMFEQEGEMLKEQKRREAPTIPSTALLPP